MRRHTLSSILMQAAAWMFAIVLAISGPSGCKKVADDSIDAANLRERPDDSGGGNDAGEDEDANDPIDPSMFDQVKSMVQMQVDSVAAQSQTVHQMLAENPDAQATELVKQMDARITEAKKLMENATSPAQSRSLKVDVPRLVGEAGELGGKAMARIQEVLRTRAGIG